MDKEFDVVFSNSVIEHVGSFEDQKKMAGEIQRVGKMYFLQTPCFRFPLEPHFFTIGFQFLPLKAKAFLIRHFNLGWYPKERDYKKSINLASSIRLLRKYELKKLFTGGRIIPERFCGLTKSLIVYNNQS
ncbi:MAG: methyltransferase domain-containing protein [Candidatus Omnitrophica bacterium]|nr:methyltransferase domain-containing protein [Candidatus Omnitrophota bacterium]